MSFVNEIFIPTGVYIITNVMHGSSIILNDGDKRLVASPTNEQKWVVTMLAKKKWYIHGHSKDISAQIKADPKEGDEIVMQRGELQPHTWVIKRCPDPQDTYRVYSPLEPNLFWSLSGPQGPLVVSPNKDEASSWKFKRLEDAELDTVKNPRIVSVKPMAVDQPTPHSPIGNNILTITIPPGWLTNISAVCVEDCVNLIRVNYLVQGALETQSFLGKWEIDGPMVLESSEVFSHVIQASATAAVLELEFFHSREPRWRNPIALQQQKEFVSNIRITSMEKPDDMRNFPEYTDLMIFDEGSDPEDETFKYNNATAFAYFSKKQPDLTDPDLPEPGAVNPGYNIILDKPRPSELDEYLENYEIVVVIDDSGSMIGQGWEEIRLVLSQFSNEVMQYDTDGIRICFLNSPIHARNIASEDDFLNVFSRVYPRFRTPTGARLKGLLNEAINKLDIAVGTPEYALIKPLDIIVLTDGAPTDKPANVIEAAARRLEEGKHHPNVIAIQFLQIGDDKEAEVALKALSRGFTRGMVDSVPYAIPFTSQRFKRVLLGALHPSIRNKM